MSQRKLAVSGQFYPNEKSELLRYFNHFNKILEDNNIPIDTSLEPSAIVVPHAGYIYSGFTANLAYRYIPKKVKNIIVIGPSHKFAFEGASIALYESYPTPLGELPINQQLNQELQAKFDFLIFDDKVHCEHSTETQFPFIAHYKNEVKVVEIIYSRCDFHQISALIGYLLENEENFVVISTDLSHFYTLKEANKLDNICLHSIVNLDLEGLAKGCEACGMIGLKGMLEVAKKQQLKPKILDYRTSADMTKDENRVVGYTSVLFL